MRGEQREWTRPTWHDATRLPTSCAWVFWRLKPSTSWFSGFWMPLMFCCSLWRWPRRSLLAAQYWKGARLLVIMIFVSKPRPISLSAWHRHKTLENSFCILFYSCFSEPQLHWVADFLCVFWCFLAPGVAHWQHLATLKDHLLLFDCSGAGPARPSDQHHWSRGLGKERRAVSLAQMALKKSYTTYMHRIPEFRPEWPFQLRKWWQSVGIQCFFLWFFSTNTDRTPAVVYHVNFARLSFMKPVWGWEIKPLVALVSFRVRLYTPQPLRTLLVAGFSWECASIASLLVQRRRCISSTFGELEGRASGCWFKRENVLPELLLQASQSCRQLSE